MFVGFYRLICPLQVDQVGHVMACYGHVLGIPWFPQACQLPDSADHAKAGSLWWVALGDCILEECIYSPWSLVELVESLRGTSKRSSFCFYLLIHIGLKTMGFLRYVLYNPLWKSIRWEMCQQILVKQQIWLFNLRQPRLMRGICVFFFFFQTQQVFLFPFTCWDETDISGTGNDPTWSNKTSSLFWSFSQAVRYQP